MKPLKIIALVKAIITGDDSTVLGLKIHKTITATLNSQISALKGNLVIKELEAEKLQESLNRALVNSATLEGFNQSQYIDQLVAAGNAVTAHENEVAETEELIAFLTKQLEKAEELESSEKTK